MSDREDFLRDRQAPPAPIGLPVPGGWTGAPGSRPHHRRPASARRSRIGRAHRIRRAASRPPKLFARPGPPPGHSPTAGGAALSMRQHSAWSTSVRPPRSGASPSASPSSEPGCAATTRWACSARAAWVRRRWRPASARCSPNCDRPTGSSPWTPTPPSAGSAAASTRPARLLLGTGRQPEHADVRRSARPDGPQRRGAVCAGR